MKKKLLLITLMFFVSISSKILAQTEQRLRLKELEFDGVKKDEYLGDKLISIDDLQAKTKAKCTEFRCEGYENISFKKYDIQHTLRMENLIRSIQGKAIRDWLFIQEKIVKTELDKINFIKTTSKYGDHYKTARGIYFEKLERGITKNNLNYYNRSYGNSIKSKKTKGTSIMKDIKRLTLRRQEIKNGNINNSSYGSYKYKGKPLSHYKSLKEVSNLLKSELSNYYNNDVAINDNQRIKNRLNQMIKDMSPSSVSKDLMLKRKNFFIDLLNSKESHFKSFSNWNELNLIQKYINKVYKGNNPGTVWPKDFGTKKFVLSHAKSKKLGNLTVFHPNYWKVILKNKYKNSFFKHKRAKADHAKLKQAEINKLIASTPINANLAVDFIVKDIKITDQNQLEWLNSIPEKEANRIKGILQMAKASWGSDLDLGSIYRQKKEVEIERIKNAGLVVQMVKTLGITNSTQKSWLYNNIPEATQIRFFVDANKIRGVVKADAKKLTKGLIEVKRILAGNFKIKTTGKYPQELNSCCPGGCCPDETIYSNDKIIKEYGIEPVQAAVDGTFNLIASSVSLVRGDEAMGSVIREMMQELGYNIPSDVADKYLGAIYRIRKRNGILIVEYKPGILRSLLGAGLDTLDVISFLSPSKGGGAFLAAKMGGKITITKLTQHIRKIGIDATKVDNLVNDLKNKAKFDLSGTGEYKKVRGHHPLAKSAFKSDKFYNLQKAFSVSIKRLDEIKIGIHAKITGQQNSLYSAFAKKGEVLTLDKMAKIEIQAMINAGVPEDIATGWVIKSLENLKAQGVKVITHIPWNGIN